MSERTALGQRQGLQAEKCLLHDTSCHRYWRWPLVPGSLVSDNITLRPAGCESSGSPEASCCSLEWQHIVCSVDLTEEQADFKLKCSVLEASVGKLEEAVSRPESP